MGDLTKSFSYSEFADKADRRLPENLKPNIQMVAKNLQILRDHFGIAIHIVSGYRTEKRQLALKAAAIKNHRPNGVATKSQHVVGKAADIVVRGYTPKQVHHAIEALIAQGRMDQGGLGLYDTFVHYDVRGSHARWYENAGGKKALSSECTLPSTGRGGHPCLTR
jgi:uncharacterized protein YcbK (DUF882 family)